MSNFASRVVACAIGALSVTAVGAETLTSNDSWDRSYWGGTLGFSGGAYTNGVSALNQTGVDIDVDGALVSVRYGQTWQTGSQVFGYDIDLGNGPSGLTPQGSFGSAWSCGSGDCPVNINALLTARGLYGLEVTDGALVYGAAGLATAAVDGGILNSPQEGSGQALGYTVAVGYERAFAQGRTVFGEINYYDLGALPFGTGNNETFDAVGSFSSLRVGVNFDF